MNNLYLRDKEGFAEALCDYTDFFFQKGNEDVPVIGWGRAGAPNLNNHSLWESKKVLQGDDLRDRYRSCQKKLSQMMKIRPNTVNAFKASVEGRHLRREDKQKLNCHDQLTEELCLYQNDFEIVTQELTQVKSEINTVSKENSMLEGHNRRLRTEIKKNDVNHKNVCLSKNKLIFETQDAAYKLERQNIEKDKEIQQQ